MRRYPDEALLARSLSAGRARRGLFGRLAVAGLTLGVASLGLPLFDAVVPVSPAAAVGTASIGDLVFNDVNANALKDTAEAGLASVTVTLKGAGTDGVLGTADDTTVGTKVTTTAGAYSFTALDAGKYRAIVTPPAGRVATTAAQFDVTLVAAQAFTTADFGLQQRNAVIGDLIYNDLNANGAFNAGEPGLASVAVTLKSGTTTVATTSTTSAGAYSFGGLAAGTYTVTATPPTGFAVSSTNPLSVTVTAGQNLTTADLGLKPVATVGDLTYVDANRNGVADAGEVGLAGVVVTVKSGTTTVGTGTSAAGGAYSVTGLAAGTYAVSAAAPSGYVISGTNPVNVTLTAGQVLTTADFGFKPTEIDGVVYSDVNGNAVRDAGEPGQAGVTVTLKSGTTTVATTTSSATGTYAFLAIAAGAYTLTETALSGFVVTGTNPVSVTATAGNAVNAPVLGQQPRNASVTGLVYNDANGNAVQDAGENGLSGVTVTLKNGATTVATATTSATGAYTFTALATATYTVTASALAGFAVTTTTPVTVVVGASQAVTATAIGEQARNASITGSIYSDTNGNGVADAGEPALAAVTVTLKSGTTTVGTATSSATGSYSFSGLAAGTYTVTATALANYVVTSTNPVTVVVTASTAATAAAIGEQIRNASIAGSVYSDTNGNAVADAGEPALAGVTLTLKSGTTTVATATSSATGTYSFTGLAAGTYTVTATALAGYAVTSTNPVTVILTASQPGSAAAIGEQPRNAVVNGSVFTDTNGNGTLDAGENGLAAVTLTLKLGATTVATATSSATGTYTFTGLAAGTYTVTATALAGYVVTSTNPVTVVVAPSAVVVAANIGERQPTGSIGGTVFNDANGNGLLDGGDSGLSGVTITVTYGATTVATGTTTATGTYTLTGLTPATYAVTATALGGFVVTTANAVPVTVAAGQSASSAAIGQQQRNASIAGTVYSDVDANGIQDAGDGGLGGVTVTLKNGATTVSTATTTASGAYSFAGLAAGTFTVTATALVDYLVTTTNPVNVTVAAGQAVTSALIGEQPRNASISGAVFNDANGNGTQDAGEFGLQGVTVSYSGTSGSGTRVTSTSGNYSITGLAAGSYTVTATALSGWAVTTTNPASVAVAASQAAAAPVLGEQQRNASIAGTVYVDANANGTLDAAEVGLAGATVTLMIGASTVASQTTTSTGIYSFPGLAAGGYAVAVVLPVGQQATSATQLSATLTAGQTVAGQNVGSMTAIADVTLPMPIADVTTLAGNDQSATVDGTGIGASFNGPSSIVYVGGALYVATTSAIRKVVAATAVTTTFAGLADGFERCGSNGPTGATSWFGTPNSLTSDGSYLYLTERCFVIGAGWFYYVRKVSLTTGATTTLSTGAYRQVVYSGDGWLYAIDYGGSNITRLSPSTGAATLVATVPAGATTAAIAADSTNVYVATTTGSVVAVALANSAVTTIPAPVLQGVIPTAITSAGQFLYVVGTRSVYRIDKTTGAGALVAGGDYFRQPGGNRDGQGTDAFFNTLTGISSSGTALYVSDAAGYRVRKLVPGVAVTPTQPAALNTNVAFEIGNVTTVAGSGTSANVDGAGRGASFADPTGAVTLGSYAYIASGTAIRRVDLASGQVTTVLSDANGCSLGHLATDGAHLYSAASCGVTRSLWKLNPDPAKLSVRIVGAISVWDVVVGPDGWLYGVDANGLERIDADTGAETLVASIPLTTGTAQQAVVTGDATGVWVGALVNGTSVEQFRHYSVSDGTFTTLPTTWAEPNRQYTGSLVSAGDWLYLSDYASVIRVDKATGARQYLAGQSGSSGGTGFADGVGADAWFTSIRQIFPIDTGMLLVDGTRLRKVVSAPAMAGADPSANLTVDMAAANSTLLAGNDTNAAIDGVGTAASFDSGIDGVTFAAGSLWTGGGGGLRRTDPATGATTTVVRTWSNSYCLLSPDPLVARIGGAVASVATDSQFVYAESTCGIVRVSIATGATSLLTATAGGSLAFTNGNLYAGGGPTLYKIDPVSGAVTSITLPGGVSIGHIAADASAIYAVTSDAQSIVRYDLTTGALSTLLAAPAATTTVSPLQFGNFVSAGSFLYVSTRSMIGSTSVLKVSKASGAMTLIAGASALTYARGNMTSYAQFHTDGVQTRAWLSASHGLGSDGTNLYTFSGTHLNKLTSASVPVRAPVVAAGATLTAVSAYPVAGGGPVSPSAGIAFGANFGPGYLYGIVAIDGKLYASTETGLYVIDPATMEVLNRTGPFALSTRIGRSVFCNDSESTNGNAGYGPGPTTDGVDIFVGADCNEQYFGGTKTVRRIVPTTGATSTISAGAAYDYLVNGPGGSLLGLARGEIDRIDPVTGAVTILSTPSSDWLFQGAASDGVNVLVSVTVLSSDHSADGVYKVNPVTGALTLWGAYGQFGGTLTPGSLAVMGGNLYANVNGSVDVAAHPAVLAACPNGSFPRGTPTTIAVTTALVRFDLASGAGTLVSGGALSCGDAGYRAGLGDLEFIPGGYLAATDGRLWALAGGYLYALTNNPPATIESLIYGYDPNSMVDGIDDVNPANGNFVSSSTEAAVSDRLHVARTYNSRDTKIGWFGLGWSSTYETSAKVTGATGDVAITFADGHREVYLHQPDGSFKAPDRFFSTLVAQGGGWVLTEKDGTSYRFDSSGRLTQIADLDNRGVTIARTTATVTVTEQPSGRTLTLTLNSSGRVTGVTTQNVAAFGKSLSWTYSYVNGRLDQVCDPRTPVRCTSYSYDAQGRIVKVTNPKGNTDAEVHYDTQGRVDWRKNGAGDTTSFGFPSASTRTTTDGRGNTTTYTYDGAQRLIQETDPTGKSKLYHYDAYGNRDQITDANGNITRVSFDARNNPIATVDGENHTRYVTYNGADDVVANRDERSASSTDDTYKTTQTFDGAHHRLTLTTPPTAEFPSGTTRTWTYTTGTEPAVDGGVMPVGLLRTESDARSNTTTYSYDAKGDLRRVVDRVGFTVDYRYDELGRKISETAISDTFPAGVTTTTTYDELGGVATVTDPPITNAVSGTTHQRVAANVYDANHNLTSTTLSDATGGDASRVTGFAYDVADRQFQVIDPYGKTLTRVFDQAGNIVQVTDQAGRVTQTAYDARNKPTVVTAKDFVDDPVAGSAPRDVVQSTTTYDDGGRKATVTDALGRVTRFGYDHADRTTFAIQLGFHNRDGSTRDIVLASTSYDAAGHPILEGAGGNKKTITHLYDQAGWETSSTLDPGGLNRTTTKTHDADGNLVRQTITDGTRTEETRYSYDSADRVLSSTVENGAVDLLTTIGRDQRGMEITVTDPNGKVTNKAFDALGRPTGATAPAVSVEAVGGSAVSAQPAVGYGYDTFGDQTHARDARGAVTATTYDLLGRKATVTPAAYTQPSSGTVLNVVESYTYDDVGNVKTSTSRRGFVTDYTYDNFNRVVRKLDPLVTGQAARGVTRYRYDDGGNRTGTTDPIGAVSSATYDDLNRVRTATQVVRGQGTFTTVYDFDDLGDKILTITPAGEQSSATYNANGELVTATDALGKITTYATDVAGRPSKMTDPLGRSSEAVYDLAGRPTTVNRYATGGTLLATTSTGYDNNSNRTTVVEPRGNVAGANAVEFTTTYGYDALNRLTSVAQPTSVSHTITTSYGYDANGNTTRATDGNGHATITSYNVWNLPESVTEPATAATPALADRVWTTSYDAGGLPVTVTEPGAATMNRTFDELGRTLTRTGLVAGVPAGQDSFGYDLAGRRTTVSAVSGTLTATWNDRGQITAVTGGTADSSFGYDADGRMITRTDPSGVHAYGWTARSQLQSATEPLTGSTIAYSWDDAGQLTGSVTANPSGGLNRNYGYDAFGRLATDTWRAGTVAGAGAVQASLGYGYDVAGNVTSKTVNLPGNTSNGTHQYTYDNTGRIASWTKPSGSVVGYGFDDAGNRTGNGATSYSFDARNRLTSDSTGATYGYNPRGGLTQITGGSQAAVFTFDGLDRLSTQTSNAGESVTYTYDGLDRVASRGDVTFGYDGFESDPTTVGSEVFSRSPDGGLLATSNGTDARLVGLDRHGDVSILAAAAGTITDTRTWTPFGEPDGSTGSIVTSVGFQGDYTDPTSGQVWMGARWYAPSLDVFTTRDTYSGELATPISLNRYTYANGNPLVFFDPDGHLPKFITDTVKVVADAAQAAKEVGQQIVSDPIGSLAEAGKATLNTFNGIGQGGANAVTFGHPGWIGVDKMPASSGGCAIHSVGCGFSTKVGNVVGTGAALVTSEAALAKLGQVGKAGYVAVRAVRVGQVGAGIKAFDGHVTACANGDNRVLNCSLATFDAVTAVLGARQLAKDLAAAGDAARSFANARRAANPTIEPAANPLSETSGSVQAIPGDADFHGPLPNDSWTLSPNGQGAHLAERVNVAGRPALSDLDASETPRFYPEGTAENAGQAHLRLHQATRAEGIRLAGGNPGLTDAELLASYERAYGRQELSGIRGALRSPRGDPIGSGLSPAEAWGKLLEWLSER